MKNNKRTLWISLAVVMVLLLGASAPFASAQLFSPYQTPEDTVTITRAEYERYQQYAQLDQIAEYIQQFYYQDADFDTLLEGAKAGMIAALDDPYSFYYTSDQFQQLWEDDEGEYAGIGIQISASYLTELCTITRTFEGSPAEKAGLRKGDVLVKVEEIDVNVYTLMDAVDTMRGTVGESVHLSVLRDNEILEFDVVRAVVHVNRVSSKMLDGDVGYILLYEFAGDCAESFKTHLDALMNQGMKALILDLRDNPGGWVTAAVDIAGNFVDGDVITYTEDKGGHQEFFYASEGKIDIPVVILVNQYSASSSEILAGALQDYGIATVVGVQSFGKGIVQRVIAFNPYDEATDGMQVTYAQYYTPNGSSLHKIGLTPDVEIAMPEEQENTVFQLGDLSDAQLEKAYEVAQDLLK